MMVGTIDKQGTPAVSKWLSHNILIGSGNLGGESWPGWGSLVSGAALVASKSS